MLKQLSIRRTIGSGTERWEENKKQKNRFVLDKNLLHQTMNAMEVPDSDENVIIIKNGLVE